MKIFKDSSLKEEVKDLDMGIVLAGSKKQVTYYLLNDNQEANVVELSASVDNKEVYIVSCPKELKSNESATIVFEWTPSLTVKKGLKSSLNLKYYELYS